MVDCVDSSVASSSPLPVSVTYSSNQRDIQSVSLPLEPAGLMTLALASGMQY